MLLIKNGTIVTHKEIFNANIVISKGKIFKITKEEIKANVVINAEGKLVLPGVIDPHVHFRQPGMNSEDWESGSKSAIAGGVTTVLDMPNNNPPTTTLKRLLEKKALINNTKPPLVNYGLHFGATENNLEDIEEVVGKRNPLAASAKIFMATSTLGLIVRDVKIIGEVIRRARMVTVHAEDEEVIEKFSNMSSHGSKRPKIAALSAINKLIQFANEGKVYILHVTSLEEAEAASPFYKEATPHHLFLNEELLKEIGNYAKVNPPLRSEEDRKSLWMALKKGLIDCIGSDHAPHLKEEKEKEDAPSGMPGVETSLPLMMNAALKKEINLEKVVELMCYNPAKIFGIKGKGIIGIGADGDIVIVDKNLEKRVTADNLHYKCKWTPYEGMLLKGWPIITIIQGEIAYKEGEFFPIKGREVVYED